MRRGLTFCFSWFLKYFKYCSLMMLNWSRLVKWAVIQIQWYQRCSPKLHSNLTLFFNPARAKQWLDAVLGGCFPELIACNYWQALLLSYGLKTCFCSLLCSGNPDRVSRNHLKTLSQLFGQAALLLLVYGWLNPAGRTAGRRKAALNSSKVGDDL